jgi:hypothetical protein
VGREQVRLLAGREHHAVRFLAEQLRFLQVRDDDHLRVRQGVDVVELEKAKLFGEESNGMVLAAGEQADLLTTHEDAVPGTRVR